MTSFFDIELSRLRFFSNHGLYAEEEKLGAEFEVNVVIRYAATGGSVNNLNDTVDYVAVYEMVKEEMATRSDLLETTAIRIASKLKERFQKIVSVRITLKKIAPPITNFTGDVSVTYEQAF